MKEADATMSLHTSLEESEHRAGQRLPVALPGQFIINGRGLPCGIVSLSRNGATIILSDDLPENVDCMAARLRIDGLRLFDVRMRWHSSHGIGLSFEKGRLSGAELVALSSTD